MDKFTIKIIYRDVTRCAANKDDSFHQDEILFNFVSKDFNFIILLSLNRRDVEKFSRLSFITHPTEITSEHNEIRCRSFDNVTSEIIYNVQTRPTLIYAANNDTLHNFASPQS